MSISCKASNCKDTLPTLDKPLKGFPAGRKRLGSEVCSVCIEHIERDVYRWSGEDLWIGIREEVKPRDEAFIKDGDLAVKDELGARQLGEGHEPCGMVEPATTDEPDSLATLVRDHAPAVDLLLVHPPWPIEGLDERWVEKLNLKRNAEGHSFPLCHVERGFACGLRAGPPPQAAGSGQPADLRREELAPLAD